MVSDEAIDRAITLLAEFPAEPAADRPGDSVDVLLNLGRVRRAREKMGRGTDAHESTVLFVSDTHLGYENRTITGRGKTVPGLTRSRELRSLSNWMSMRSFTQVMF